MRISISATRLALLLAGLVSIAGLSPAAYSGNDFSALLEDLSFGASDASPSRLTSANQNQVAESLQSAQSVSRRAITPPPTAALSAPVAIETAVPNHTRFDLSAAAALQSQELGNATLVGCVRQNRRYSAGCDVGGCDSAPCSTGHCSTGHCGDQCVSGQCSCNPGNCMPRRPVQLPTSSFLEYFGSDPCHTGVWDNYSRGCNRLYQDCEPCNQKKRGCAGGGCGEILPPMPRPRRVGRVHVQPEPACDSCDG